MSDVREELAALFCEATLVGADYAPQLAERALVVVTGKRCGNCKSIHVPCGDGLHIYCKHRARRKKKGDDASSCWVLPKDDPCDQWEVKPSAEERLRAENEKLRQEVVDVCSIDRMLDERILEVEGELAETKAEAMEFARECIEAQGRAIEGLKEKNEQLARWRAELRKARETCCRGKLCSPDADVRLTRLEGIDR